MTTSQTTYAAMFKNWQVKVLGPKPGDDLLNAIHNLGARPGKQALANAMMLREGGATASQIVVACGAPQLNKMRAFVAAGVVKRDANVAASPEGHTVYKLTLTPKGQAKVKTAEARAAEAAKNTEATPADKPKGKGTKTANKAARKAKVKAATTEALAETPAPEAAAVTETPLAPEAGPVEPATTETVN